MPAGAYHIEQQEVDEFAVALRRAQLGVTRGLAGQGAAAPEMKAAYTAIGKRGAYVAAQRAPVGTPSRKDSRSHPRPGGLRESITSSASATNAYVIAKWDGPLILQEFGGRSFWSRQISRGMLRKGNRAHRNVVEAAQRAMVSGHVVYQKPRQPRGYFIWNWAWRIRDYVGETLAEGMRRELSRYGVQLEVALGGGLQGDLRAEEFRRVA